jgi:uncharacterized protein (DUF58 family)
VVGLLLLALVLLALGSAQGWSLLHTLGYSVLLTIILSYLWAWSSVRGLYVRPRPRVMRSQVGATLEERSEIENLTWLPRPWLEILDAGNHPQHSLSQVLSLAPVDRRTRVLRTHCRQRGQFTLGPVWLAGGDPFGLFRRERRVAEPTTLVVFPATVELPAFGRLPGELLGGSLQGERVHYVTSNVSSIRDYQPGDSFNRVHWASTARRGALMVKEFERDPFSDLWLILDLDQLVQVGRDENSTEEVAVTIAASLGRHFLEQDRAVGVLTQGKELPADRGPRQLLRLLEFLAVVRPVRRSLEELLVAESQRFNRRDTLVLITPSAESAWVQLTRDLARRGVRSSAVLLDAPTFGPAPSSTPTLASLEAANIPTYLIPHLTDLSRALSTPMTARQ